MTVVCRLAPHSQVKKNKSFTVRLLMLASRATAVRKSKSDEIAGNFSSAKCCLEEFSVRLRDALAVSAMGQ